MSNIKKLLSRFDREEGRVLESLIKEIVSLNWVGLDVKKLKGHQNIFRVRKGRLRIIFAKDKKDIFIFAIERRPEDIYKL